VLPVTQHPKAIKPDRMPVLDIIPGLGLFAKLPIELRDMIWAEFLRVSRKAPARYPLRKQSLSILRTSEQISEEVCQHIYPSSKASFLIELSPDIAREDLNVHITLTWLHAGKVKTRKLRDEKELGYMYHMGGSQRALRFNLYLKAASSKDTGQRIVLYERLIRVVDALGRMKTPPYCIKVVFQNSSDGDWFPNDDDKDEASLRCLTEIMLPLLTLRNVKEAVFELPKNANVTPKRLLVIQGEMSVMRSTQAFGGFVRKGGVWSDKNTLALMIMHEKALVDLKATGEGRTCMLLRLKAYIEFYSTEYCLICSSYSFRDDLEEGCCHLESTLFSDIHGGGRNWSQWVADRRDQYIREDMIAQDDQRDLRQLGSCFRDLLGIIRHTGGR
jgi:hypothetical protein